ncbi:hypothetical protein BCR33DRAFT_719561 [Rhizoclosmatium globosum]|uniref:SPRY domain-containing protein n=1 Tax=Rhizoclosmatium globosum TaxID=329046 RepID=A0A1Y2BZG7_9FUNG|nr:hypothetical protein BCR33DRAFT_719561 [Rhizoclosmatium globosum]|eukprot:ORY40172.1 hypothetical protein BCR33DRAFT_719561 [Rhizoclosmatium globosum]
MTIQTSLAVRPSAPALRNKRQNTASQMVSDPPISWCLLSLPIELLQHIALTFLDATDLAHFAATCRIVREAAYIPRAASLAMISDASGLGFNLRYDPSVLPYGLVDETWDAESTWQVPGVLIPPYARTSLNNTHEESLIPGVVRPNARVGSRLKVSRSATSRVPLTVISKHCFKKDLAYFEVTFTREKSKGGVSSDVEHPELDVMVGLISKGFINKSTHLPNNDLESITYESIYGMTNLGPRRGEGFQFGPPYTFGDTVGVGIIPHFPSTSPETVSPPADLLFPHKTPHTNTIFFTLNGHLIGDAPLRVSSDLLSYNKALFPSIGFVTSTTPILASVNFGQCPFKFSMDSYIENILSSDLAMASRVSHLSPQSKSHVALRFIPPSPADFSAQQNCSHRMELNSPAVVRKGEETGFDPIITFDSPTTNEGHGVQTIKFMGTSYIGVRNVQSPIPLLPGGYFEVKILRNSALLPEDDETTLRIGLAQRPYSQYYHLFDGAGQGGFPWDIVGCGMFGNGDIYFTKNGELVGPKKKMVREGDQEDSGIEKLHPMISACQQWEVEVNFGGKDFAHTIPSK